MSIRQLWMTITIIVLVLMSSLVHAEDATPRLYIPHINMDVPIGECALVDGWHVIGDGVCHLEGTATLGHDWARMVLAGHSPGVFESLIYLEIGDQVMVWDMSAVEVYRVALITVTTVDDTRWLMPTDDETLTLITCAGDQRRIIHAEREQ